MSPSPTERAWLAGMIDGEGWIGISRHLTKRRWWLFSLRFSMSQNNLATLERCRHLSGGLGRIHKHSGAEARAWKWSMQGEPVKQLIALVERYLWEKKARAQVAVWFPISMSTRRCYHVKIAQVVGYVALQRLIHG